MNKTKGRIILLTGPNGTEKTAAVKTLTSSVGQSFRTIQSAHLIGKYIGETEKNLKRILAAGSKTQSILFFDEADALFGKRTKVSSSHDRYANQEVSYLFQHLQAYPGLVILGTNQKSRLSKTIVSQVTCILQVVETTKRTARKISATPRSKK